MKWLDIIQINSGKTIEELAAEYGVAKSTIRNQEKQYKNSKKFRIKANLSDKEKEVKRPRKK